MITETASALFLIGSKAIISENLAIGLRAKVFSLRYTLYLSQFLLVTDSADNALKILSAVLACNAITVILMQYQIGRFLKREQLPYLIVLGTVLFAAGLIGFSFAHSLVAWCAAMFVFTLGEMIIYPAEYLFVDTIAPEALRGSYYGAQNLAAFGGALSPVICGYLLINSPPASMFYVLSGLTLLGGALCFISGRRARLPGAEPSSVG